jgi:hypothetical protein
LKRSFLLSRANGHSLEAQQSLKRFFDFRQLTIADRGLHQHALLNLVNLHYEDGAYLLARNAINEAVRLARQVGDRECLNACFGLSKRLDYVDPHGKAQTQGFWSEDFSTQLSIDEFWQVREGLRNVKSRFESCTRRLTALVGRAYHTCLSPPLPLESAFDARYHWLQV